MQWNLSLVGGCRWSRSSASAHKQPLELGGLTAWARSRSFGFWSKKVVKRGKANAAQTANSSSIVNHNMSPIGTWQNRAHGVACPQLARADVRAFGRHSGFGRVGM